MNTPPKTKPEPTEDALGFLTPGARLSRIESRLSLLSWLVFGLLIYHVLEDPTFAKLLTDLRGIL
jgi:hypothetical protein